MDFNVTVPVGTVNHGVGNLICTPPQWNDYIFFFFANYVAHAASLPSRPGEHWHETVIKVTTALFVPGFGALQTMRHLCARARWSKKGELDCATKAGALAMIVRRKARNDNETSGSVHEKFATGYSHSVITWQRAIFGRCDLNPKLRRDFRLVTVTTNTPLTGYPSARSTEEGATARGTVSATNIHLANTYNIPKLLVAAFQAVWGSITIYKTRGDQLERYGYAAFGLSVAPYVFMSLVNIVMSLVTPEYPVMYLVHTPDMDEAVAAGAIIEGVVASVDLDAITEPINFLLFERAEPRSTAGRRLDLSLLLTLGAILMWTPLIIVGLVSEFRKGQSTPSQRGWLISWLVVGTTSSIWALLLRQGSWGLAYTTPYKAWLDTAVYIFPVYIPAIGGMVTVARMLKEYGICTRFDL